MNHTPLMVNHHGEVLGALPILLRQVVSDNGIGSVFSGGWVKGFPDPAPGLSAISTRLRGLFLAEAQEIELRGKTLVSLHVSERDNFWNLSHVSASSRRRSSRRSYHGRRRGQAGDPAAGQGRTAEGLLGYNRNG